VLKITVTIADPGDPYWQSNAKPSIDGSVKAGARSGDFSSHFASGIFGCGIVYHHDLDQPFGVRIVQVGGASILENGN
jgi:hypothetical protein